MRGGRGRPRGRRTGWRPAGGSGRSAAPGRAGLGEADAPEAAAPGRDGRLPGLQLMAPTLLLALALLRTGHPLGKAPSRPPRGILQLAGMIQCTTGRTPLAYIRYGCYCGWGGRGWPKDQVDWCCFKHDCCYGKAEEENCAPKMRRYPWECQESKAKCDDIGDKCQKMACECDRDAAKCLAKAPYNVTLLFWPDSRCAEKGPTCPDD